MLFSQRYKDIIWTEDHGYNKDFIDDLWIDKKERIVEVLEEFAQPRRIKKSRYDDETEETTALEMAVNEYNSINRYNREIDDSYFGFGPHLLTSIATDMLWDLIELQSEFLSFDEQVAFQNKLNKVLEEQEIQWKLIDGRMVKLDSEQFTFDLKMKTLNEIKKLRDEDAKFQGAFNELQNAFSSLDSGKNSEAVNWAEMSYESMLKVINGTDRGNANALTKELLEKSGLISLPETIKAEGFKENVLMTLPYIRNNITAHGAGSKQVKIDAALANLAVNMACALETYLVEVYKKQ